MKPINKLAALGMSRAKKGHWVPNEKPPILINADRLPDNSEETIKWMQRHGIVNCPKDDPVDSVNHYISRLQKLTLRTCVGPDGTPIGFVIAGIFKKCKEAIPLRYTAEFSRRADCWPFLEEFVVRRRAECAAVLLGRRLGVRPTKPIVDSVTKTDLEYYYPVESREKGELGDGCI